MYSWDYVRLPVEWKLYLELCTIVGPEEAVSCFVGCRRHPTGERWAVHLHALQQTVMSSRENFGVPALHYECTLRKYNFLVNIVADMKFRFGDCTREADNENRYIRDYK